MGKKTKKQSNRKKMKNILKIVFLGIIGFGLLTYLTAPKNPNKNEISSNKKVLNINFIPRYLTLCQIILIQKLKHFLKKVLKNI